MVSSRSLKTYFLKLFHHWLDLTTESLCILLEGHYTLIGRSMSQKFQIPLKLFSNTWLRQHVVCDFHWITLFRTDQIEKYAGCKEN